MTTEGLIVEATDTELLYNRAEEMADRQPEGRIMLSDTPLTTMFGREQSHLSVMDFGDSDDSLGIVLSGKLFLAGAGYFSRTQINSLVNILTENMTEVKLIDDNNSWEIFMKPTEGSEANLYLRYQDQAKMRQGIPAYTADNRNMIDPRIQDKISRGYPNDDYLFIHLIRSINGVSPLRDGMRFAQAVDMHAVRYKAVIEALHQAQGFPPPKGEILFSARKAV